MSTQAFPSGDAFQAARRLKAGGSQDWLPHDGSLTGSVATL